MTRALYTLLLGLAALLTGWAFRTEPAVLACGGLTALAWLALAARQEDGPGRDLPRWAGPVAIVVAVALCCLPTLDADFLGDDLGYVRLFHDQPLAESLRLGDISHGIWGHPLDELRPVFALSYELSLLLFGVDARGFHVLNLGLHVAASLLVYALAATLQPGDRRPALAAGLLFGLMPVHAEPIAWITGKVDSLPACFYLATLLLFLRFRATGRSAWYLGALAVFAPGLFSKEILITLPAVLLLADLLLAPREGRLAPAALLRAHAPFVLLTALFLLVRRSVFESFAREGRAGSAARLLAFVQAQPQKLRWLLAPFEGGDAARMVATGLCLGILAGAALWLWRRRAEHERCLAAVAFCGLAFYAVTLLPLLVTYPSPRHLYLPSAGTALALALVLFLSAPDGPVRAGRLRGLSLAVLALAFGAGLWQKGERWRAAGGVARTGRAQIEQLTRGLPPGSVLVLSGFPATADDILIYRFALPFALQPPFVPRDAYGPYQVVEPPDLYCCPLQRWWQDKREAVLGLLRGDPDAYVPVTLVHWNERRGTAVLRQGLPQRRFLRAQLERAVGGPLEGLEDLPGASAHRLVATLAAVVRLTTPRLPGDPVE